MSNKKCELHYRHKLNMLEPGIIMTAISFILIVLGTLLFALGFETASFIAFILAAAIFIVLIVLVSVELHQDKKLYEWAKSKDPQIK